MQLHNSLPEWHVRHPAALTPNFTWRLRISALLSPSMCVAIIRLSLRTALFQYIDDLRHAFANVMAPASKRREI